MKLNMKESDAEYISRMRAMQYESGIMWQQSKLDPSNPDHIKILNAMYESKTHHMRIPSPYCYLIRDKVDGEQK